MVSSTRLTLVGVPAIVVMFIMASVVMGVGVKMLGSWQEDAWQNTTYGAAGGGINYTCAGCVGNDSVNVSRGAIDGAVYFWLLQNRSQNTSNYAGIAPNSVRVANVTNLLTENTDYAVNYSYGQIRFLNTSITRVQIPLDAPNIWNITYNYLINSTTSEYDVYQRGKDGVMEISDWQDEMMLVVATVVLIGLLYGLFGTQRGRRS